MSKYDKLWEYVAKCEKTPLALSFEEAEGIAGVPIDHSFLRYKRELEGYGGRVVKISLKESSIVFERNAEQAEKGDNADDPCKNKRGML